MNRVLFDTLSHGKFIQTELIVNPLSSQYKEQLRAEIKLTLIEYTGFHSENLRHE